MKTSSKGIKAISLREGTILHGYKDSKGLLTIGVGHLVKPGEPYTLGGKITQAESDRLLTEDLHEAETAINKAVKVPLTQNQFDALVSFVVNIGVGGFQKSQVLKKLNAKDYNGAAKALMNWVTPPEITGRRRSEQKQFLTQDSAVPQITSHTESDSTTQGKSSDTPPINSDGHNVKAEITPEGGVKVETTEGTPAPKERIAVVKTAPEKWSSRVTAKITAAVTGSALFQWLWAQMEKIQGMSVPDAVWVIVSVTIAVGSLLWIMHEIVDTWRANRNQERVDELLVKENSTAGNLVQLIPSDEIDLYRARGFKIITRGEKA